MDMPFGPYEGVPLEEIPTDYLVWVVDCCDSADQRVKRAIRRELAGMVRPQEEPTFDLADIRTVLLNWYARIRADYQACDPAYIEVLDHAYRRLYIEFDRRYQQKAWGKLARDVALPGPWLD